MLNRCHLNRDGVFIENYARKHQLWLTLLALHFISELYWDLKREDGSEEADHATRVCCDLIDRCIIFLAPLIGMKIIDIIFAVALLHDVLEHKKTTLKELEEIFGRIVAYNVDLLTKRKEHKRNPGKYYRRISRSVIAVLVKSVDKENVAGTIIKVAKTARRLKGQAKEVHILLPIMKRMRNRYENYKNILISCRNHLQNSLIGIEKHIETMRENEKLKKDILALRKEAESLKGKKK